MRKMKSMDNGTCNGHTVVTGEVAGSHQGHYVSLRAVEIALELGWNDKYAWRAAGEYGEHYHEESWDFFDSWSDIVDHAEAWLNNHSYGLLWYFHEGSFRVDSTSECPECGCDRFDNPDADDNDCEAGHLWIEC